VAASSSSGPTVAAAHPLAAGMQRERLACRVEVRDQQAAAGLGHPLHLAERRLPLARRDVVHRERAGRTCGYAI
jgi:hypothetical protein